MADEIQVLSGLVIRKGNLNYQSLPNTFTADLTGSIGPTPGAIVVDTLGVDVSFAQLTTPGVCRIMNIDDTNYVEWGVYDPETDVFYPVGELLPGESYVFRLTRNFGEEYAGTGTGTTSPTNRFRVKANTAQCVVVVEAFEV